MKIRLGVVLIVIIMLIITLTSVTIHKKHNDTNKSTKKTIITTNVVLESITKDLVGDNFVVTSMIPNGSDPHMWEPSAKDIELLTKADLIVENGLQLESSMAKALNQAHKSGIQFFTATDHTQIRHLDKEEIVDPTDDDQIVGAKDPHIWTDPIAIKDVVMALSDYIKSKFNIDLSDRAASLNDRLSKLDAEIKSQVNTIPINKRNLVTGHDSLGYFAKRYGFKVIGAVIPNITTETESSAANLKILKTLINQHKVPTIFTEIGTPQKTVEKLARETKVKVIMLSTHNLSSDISYFTFERNLANVITKGLA